MSVPALIVPILNRPELLYKMLASIDYPIDRVVIIDNGALFARSILPGDGEAEIMRQRNANLGQVEIVSLPHNLGVATSWNLGMRATPFAPWWLIVNHDLTFGAGDLESMDESVNPGAAAIYFMFGMSSFAITRHTVNVVGTFDENFINGYDEDVDFARRIDLAGLPRVETGFTGTHEGSATIMADPAMRAWNGNSHGANDLYYAQKWGGQKQGGETFDTPFKRGGHLGDWRFDPERYRNLTWPRPNK